MGIVHVHAVSLSTEAFQDVGPLSEDNPLRRKWAEVSYSQRSAGKYLAIKSPDMLVFKHIGELTCPGWPIYDSGAATVQLVRGLWRVTPSA